MQSSISIEQNRLRRSPSLIIRFVAVSKESLATFSWNLPCTHASVMEPLTLSEATWAAMRSGLRLELVLLIFRFTSTTFYESREANRFCYRSQREFGRLRASLAKTALEEEANKIFRVYLRICWDRHQVDDNHSELSMYRQWWCWLVRSAHDINMVLQNAHVRSWRLRVHEFATVNADVLTRLCQQEGGAELTDTLTLPVWTDEPVSWRDPILGRIERNAHLEQRLGDKPLSSLSRTDDPVEDSYVWETMPDEFMPEVIE